MTKAEREVLRSELERVASLPREKQLEILDALDAAEAEIDRLRRIMAGLGCVL